MRLDATLPERVAALHALEQRHALFAAQVDGWSAWRVLRNPLQRLAEALPLAQPPSSTVARVLNAARATLGLLAVLVRAPRRELLVKTCRSGLRMKSGDGYRDVYFDGLLEQGYSFLKIEEVNSPDFAQQAARARFPAGLDPVVFTFWGKVLGSLFPLRSARRFCDELAPLLQREVGIEVGARWLQGRISTAFWQARLYGLLLRRVRPRAVLVSDTGEYGLSIACKRHQVRFIELQHGVFDAQHPDAIPAQAPGSAAQLILPDVLACRGAFWIAQLDGTRQGRDHAIAVGNELIDQAQQRRRLRPRGAVRRLVLTSQGLDSARLAAWVGELVASADSGLDWELAIKLHPVYDADNRAFDGLGADPRIRVIGGAEQPNVFDLLAEADLHLSIASACHYDAAALGVPSVIIPLAGHEAMLHAADGRLIHLAGAPAGVWPLLAREGGADLDGARFSAPGFLNNMRRLLA